MIKKTYYNMERNVNMNSHLKNMSSKDSRTPYDIKLAPDIRIKARNKLGFRLILFAFASSNFHILE